MNKSNQLQGKPWTDSRTNFDRNLAVVIGIDRYEDENIHYLSTPVSDANAFANLLETEYEYKPENVLRLINEKATLEELRTLLTKKLPNELKPTERDRLIFYFAGHGLPKNSDEGPTGYLVPQDAKLGQESSFLPMSDVYEALNQLQCHHLLVVLDCCFAGTFRWANSRKLIAELETIRREHYDRFIRHPAWQVITSSAHDQEALDFVKLSEDRRGNPIQVNNERHSPFALALLEALQEGEADSQGKRYQNADFTKDGVITAHELFVYLSDRVSKLAKELQTPGLYPLKREYDKGEFIFVKPGFDPQQLLPAPELNEENNPYRGLKSFEERHANFFFGRQKLVEELSDRLGKSHRPLTVVLGTSGSGKSSLVKAGLVPYLRQQEEKDESAQRWYILDPIRPGKSPFAELARAVLPVANSNLIARLAEVSFIDRRFAEILDPKSKQEATSQNPTSSGDRAQPSSNNGDKSFDATKLAERWNKATPEAKLLLALDYFEQLQDFFHLQSEEQAQLSSLHDEINNTLKPLTENLQHQPESFIGLMTAWSQNHPKTKLLLVIDQFEELITMSQDDRESGKQSDSQEQDEQKQWQRFLILLRMTLAKYRRQLHVIVTLRSDFEPRFLNSALKAQWKEARFPVRAMNSDELRDAIEGPALKQALYFEPPELVGKLIDEVGQMPGALPLLSFTLSELYIKLFDRWMKDRSTDRALRIKDYEELGGVAGALTRRATEEYDDLVRDFGEASGKAYQATMRRVMLRMVTIEGGGVARRRVPESELVYPDAEENKRVAQVSDRLVNARLLVKGRETGEPYMEPAHDFLVRGWDKLQQWVKKEQENIILYKRLTPAAVEWNSIKIHEKKQPSKIQDNVKSAIIWLDKRLFVIENLFSKVSAKVIKCLWQMQTKISTEKSTEFLWDRNPFLKSVNKKKYSDKNWLNKIENIFVQESTLQKRRNISWRWRIITGVILGLNGLTLFAFIEQQKSRQESVRALTATSQAFLLGDREFDALIEAIKAGEIAQKTLWWSTQIPFKTKLILAQVNNTTYEFNRWVGYGGRANKVKYSPDGKILASAGNDGLLGTVKIWDLKGNLLAKLIVGETNIEDIKFSPDSKMLAILTINEKNILWKIQDNLIIQPSQSLSYQRNNDWASFSLQELQKVRDEGYIAGRIENECLGYKVRSGYDTQSQRQNNLIEFDGGIDELVSFSYADGSFLNSLSCHPNGKILASAGEDGSIKLWKASKKAPRIEASNIVFSNDGQKLFSLKGGKTIEVWKSNGEILDRIHLPVTDPLRIATFSLDGKILASVNKDNIIQLWDLNSKIPKILASFKYPGKQLDNLILSPDGKMIAVFEKFRLIKIIRTDGKLLKQISHSARINKVAFSPNSKNLVYASHDGTIKLWNFDNKKSLIFKGHKDFVWDVSFSSDGRMLVSASADRTIKIWNINGTIINTLKASSIVKTVNFSPDSSVVISTDINNNIIFWRQNGEIITTFQNTSSSVIFSPDNQTLAFIKKNEHRVDLWSLSIDEQLAISCNWLSDYLLIIHTEEFTLCKK